MKDRLAGEHLYTHGISPFFYRFVRCSQGIPEVYAGGAERYAEYLAAELPRFWGGWPERPYAPSRIVRPRERGHEGHEETVRQITDPLLRD